MGDELDEIKRGCCTEEGESMARKRALIHQEVLSRQAKRFHVLDRVSVLFLRRFSGRTRGFTSRLSLNSSQQLWSTGQDKGFYALSEFGAHNLTLTVACDLR